jgi:hypothetical protein
LASPLLKNGIYIAIAIYITIVLSRVKPYEFFQEEKGGGKGNHISLLKGMG